MSVVSRDVLNMEEVYQQRDHRITEWFGGDLGRGLKDHLVPTSLTWMPGTPSIRPGFSETHSAWC